jgi:hypothetical protein
MQITAMEQPGSILFRLRPPVSRGESCKQEVPRFGIVERSQRKWYPFQCAIVFEKQLLEIYKPTHIRGALDVIYFPQRFSSTKQALQLEDSVGGYIVV